MCVCACVRAYVRARDASRKIPFSWMVHAGSVFVASILPSMTCMSVSSGSMQWYVDVQRLDLSLYSHPKKLWGME